MKYSEEEIKAIGWLSALDVKSEFEATNKEIILNLIEKQQKEIESKDVEIDCLKSQLEVNEELIDSMKKNSVSKDKIREIFEKINQCKIRTDGKVNAKNYMICGETERAYGWFINLDYIEKILLARKGYNIGE